MPDGSSPAPRIGPAEAAAIRADFAALLGNYRAWARDVVASGCAADAMNRRAPRRAR